jgi:NADPH-dependent 2,4-dienoyl-CoA reductase/sulfur reductase-like enzyme/rhodanese-related sulfurtransferase
MQKTIVIVGGSAGGASAAAKARRTDEKAKVIIFERGPYVSYANCGLPYYVGGDTESRDDLFLVSPERFNERFNVEVRVNHEVMAIDRKEKRVRVVALKQGEEFAQPYDKLILATGAVPLRPPIPGIDKKNIFTLWTVPDADRIKGLLAARKPRKAAVVGAGSIGLESAEALKNLGLEVFLVEMMPQVYPGLDPEMAQFIASHLESMGIKLFLGSPVARFLGEEAVDGIELDNGQRLAVDLVIMAAGGLPQTQLAREAGLEIGPSGGVVTNERMETSDPDIYAAGDMAEITHLVTGRKMRLALAGPANKEGRVAGANAAGGNLRFVGAWGSAIIKVGKLTAARTGLSEKEAREAGLDYYVSYTHSPDHANYYPGAQTMALKLVVERETGRLLGGQAVGPQGVDKRIDVLATAIYSKLTVEDLEHLDLAYSPPYSSAKDPTVMAGMVAGNLLRGEVEAMTVAQLAEALETGKPLQVVDVRTPKEYRKGKIPGAVNIPLEEMRSRWQELEPDKDTVLYCRIGYRSYLACRILMGHGFNRLKNMSGGYLSWMSRTQDKPDPRTSGTID